MAEVGVMRAEDARCVDELNQVVRSGGRVEYLHFWKPRAHSNESLDGSCLSQWWPSLFEADGERFPSAEHYMMWRKARLFDDQGRAAEILAEPSPARVRTIGRRVAGFDEETWAAHRWEIVVDASLGKFGSDAALGDYLLGTSSRVLVEASPLDRVWGIGLAADSEFAEVPSRWRGLNLLGFALMEARARLAPPAASSHRAR